MIESMFEDAKAEQSAKRRVEKPVEELEDRPPRRGYSRTVEALYDVADNLVALRAEMGHWPQTQTARAFSKRPWFPAEVVQEKMRKRARVKVNSAIEMAQARWRQRHDDTGSGT